MNQQKGSQDKRSQRNFDDKINKKTTKITKSSALVSLSEVSNKVMRTE